MWGLLFDPNFYFLKISFSKPEYTTRRVWSNTKLISYLCESTHTAAEVIVELLSMSLEDVKSVVLRDWSRLVSRHKILWPEPLVCIIMSPSSVNWSILGATVAPRQLSLAVISVNLPSSSMSSQHVNLRSKPAAMNDFELDLSNYKIGSWWAPLEMRFMRL